MEYDLIICVFGCDTIEKYRNQILKIEETYGKLIKSLNNCKILYFLGKTEVLHGEQFIHLENIDDDYMSASYKQWYGIKYIYENYKTKFVMCIGTDTYININKLLKLLSNFNHTEELYLGGHGCFRSLVGKSIYFHSGGPGFILSYNAINRIYPFINDVNVIMSLWINVCKQSNVKLLEACDVAIGYLADLLNLNTIKLNGFYYCNFNGDPCHINNINHRDIISCHNMSSNNFDDFTKILNDNGYFI
jgi:hypothetical protein